MSTLEQLLMFQIRSARLPTPEREVRFHDKRKWRFDLAWPAHMLAMEIDGGTNAGGRHTRGKGFENDCEKLNAASVLGWRVLRATSAMVKDGRALQAVEAALMQEAA